MKITTIILMVIILFAALLCGCSSQQQGQAPQQQAAPPASTITAVFGSTVSKKPAVKALAKKAGEGEISIYMYSFDPKENQWPDGAAYAADDFFLDVTIKAAKSKKIEPGEYKGDQISPTLHTKTTNYGFLKDRGSIVITSMEGGKLKGELKLDDDHVKVLGPIDMDLL
jgi:ABC-type Fe3+-hydroxamate transport system substrate-binding protein